MSKKDSVLVVVYEDSEGLKNWVNFEFVVDLPFPIYLPQSMKIVMCTILLLILIVGLNLRSKIFAYIQSPETKMIPINILLWFDFNYTL